MRQATNETADRFRDNPVLPQCHNDEVGAVYAAYDSVIDRPDIGIEVRAIRGHGYESRLLGPNGKMSTRYATGTVIAQLTAACAMKATADYHYCQFVDSLDRGRELDSMTDGAGATVRLYDAE